MDATQTEIASRVIAQLESGQAELPTLPDIALKLKGMLDDPDFSNEQVVGLITTDPVIALHVIRAANSAALSAGHPVYNLRDAVSRLGYRMLHGMIINITLNRLFRAASPLIDAKLRELWKHSREVAANSYVLARDQSRIKPEVAMLAGLVHNIGALPLYMCADRYYPQIAPETLESLVNEYAAAITPRLLKNWNFPEELIEIVAGHAAQKYPGNIESADYINVLTIAKLQAHDQQENIPWRNMLAAEKLGYYLADCRRFLTNHTEQLAAVKSLLLITASHPA
ncbi:MAG: HDOD domain-containing protein [Gallionella sp.]|nr:HDOD domain-containing protein [Gallionella sp.]